MTKGILAVLTVGVGVGTLAGVLAGPLTGIGMFAGSAVFGLHRGGAVERPS